MENMIMRNLGIYISVLLILILLVDVNGQSTVPLGINYQAVARDNFGKELSNTNINVRFSIIFGDPDGSVVYQEIHQNIITSKYGVFSLIIGAGVPSGNSLYSKLSDLEWDRASHFLKVEVKFANDYLDMGTMQFLAVPYALYAQKSLEPGPQGIQGLKGDPGDPASDDQTLSFDGTNLSISVGNGGTPSTVNLSTLIIPHQLSILGDTLSIFGGNKVGLPNHIQNLILDDNNILKIDKNSSATAINLTRFLDDKQTLSFTPADNKVYISGGNSIDLTPLKQDLKLDANILTITNKLTPTEINLSAYLQQLTFTEADSKLAIAGGNTVDLTALKNDADADPTNEIQDLKLTGDVLTATKSTAQGIDLSVYMDNTDNQKLGFNPATYSLSLTGSTSVSIGSLVAFRAKKTSSSSAPMPLSNVDFIPDELEYNDGNGIIIGTGEFTAAYTGNYTFDIKYIAPSSGDGRMIMLYKNGNLYENLGSGISSGTTLFRTLTIKLLATDKIKFVIHTGTGTDIGTGVFSGYRVY